MNKIWISTLLLTLTTAISAAPIFECTDSAGRKVYTQAGGKNCKASNIGKPSVYTSAPVSTPATPISPSKRKKLSPRSIRLTSAQPSVLWIPPRKTWKKAKKCVMAMNATMPAISNGSRVWKKPSARLRKTMTRRNTSLHLKILLPIDPYHTSKAV